MAEDENKTVADDKLSALKIISTIEKTSAKELDVLLSIDKKLDGRAPAGKAAPTSPKRDDNDQRPTSRPSRNAQPEQKSNPRKPRTRSHSSTSELGEERDDGLRITRRAPRRGRQGNDQEIIPHKRQQPSTATVPEQPAPQPKSETPAEQVRKRDSSGRFSSSADKAKEKREDARHQELIDEEKKGQTLFQKLSGFMERRSTKEVEGTAIDAAGAAAGGSFWKAGKEAWELVSNTHEMLTKGKDDDDGEKKGRSLFGKAKGLFRRKGSAPPAPGTATGDIPVPSLKRTNSAPAILKAAPLTSTVRGFGMKGAMQSKASAGSLDVANRNVQKAVVTKTEEQTQAIQEGDRLIVERLDELLEKNGSGNKGGGLLGKLLGGKIGKALAGIAGLWVAKYGKKLFSALIAAVTAAVGLGRSRGGGGRDASPDIDVDRNKTPGGKKNKKPSSKPKGKSWVKKLLNNPVTKTAAATVATGAAAGAAVKAIDTKPVSAADAAKESAQKAKASAPKTGDNVKVGRPVAAEERAAQKAEKSVATKATAEATEKGALKAAAKGTAKMGMRAVPLLGSLVMAAVDAYDGYSDEEAQREAFGVEEGKAVTTGEKASFSAANILDMGGLVSGASGLLASGARAIGMDGVADSLTFDTGDIAKGIHGAASSAKDAVTSLFSGPKEADSKTEAQTKHITDTLKEGTKDTIKTLEDTSKRLIDTITETNPLGDAEVIPLKGVGVGSNGPAVSSMQGPSETTMTPDLNVGGSKAKVRSFRNNNFGNIKFANQAGAVLEKKNALGEQEFAHWNTPEEGLRGTANQIMLYQTGKSKWGKLETLNSMFDVFAPSSQNNTEQYKQSLEKQLGISRHDKVDWSDPDKMRHLVRAIGTVEGGGAIQMSDADMAKAIGHYNFETNRWEGEFTDQSLEKINAQRAKTGEAPLKATDLFSIGNPLTGRGDIPKANGVNQPSPADVTPVTPAPEPEPEQHAQAAKKKQEITPPQNAATAGATTPEGITAASVAGAVGAGAKEIGGYALAGVEGLRQKGTPAEVTHQSAEISKEKREEDAQRRINASIQNGEQYTAAKIPLTDTPIIGDIIKKFGGDHVANAEGLRHQAAPGSNAMDRAVASQAGKGQPTPVIPARTSAAPQTVTGVASYSHPKELYSVTDLQSATPAMPAAGDKPAERKAGSSTGDVDMKMLAALNKIAGLLEDIKKEGSSKDTPRFTSVKNSPQPAPRATIPLSVADPTMSSLASS